MALFRGCSMFVVWSSIMWTSTIFAASPKDCEPLQRVKASRESITAYQGTAVLVHEEDEFPYRMELSISRDDAEKKTRFDFVKTSPIASGQQSRPDFRVLEERHLYRDAVVERWFAESEESAVMEIVARGNATLRYKPFDARVTGLGSEGDFLYGGLAFSDFWKVIEGCEVFDVESSETTDRVGLRFRLLPPNQECFHVKVLEIDRRKGDVVTKKTDYLTIGAPESFDEIVFGSSETTTTEYVDIGGAWLPSRTQFERPLLPGEKTPHKTTIDFVWDAANLPVPPERFERKNLFDWRGGRAIDATGPEPKTVEEFPFLPKPRGR